MIYLAGLIKLQHKALGCRMGKTSPYFEHKWIHLSPLISDHNLSAHARLFSPYKGASFEPQHLGVGSSNFIYYGVL